MKWFLTIQKADETKQIPHSSISMVYLFNQNLLKGTFILLRFIRSIFLSMDQKLV